MRSVFKWTDIHFGNRSVNIVNRQIPLQHIMFRDKDREGLSFLTIVLLIPWHAVGIQYPTVAGGTFWIISGTVALDFQEFTGTEACPSRLILKYPDLMKGMLTRSV